MSNKVFKPLIERFRNQDMEAFALIYEAFRRLINLYASKIRYEDGVSELTLFLIEVLYGLDLSRFKSDDSFGIQKYIAVSLRNKYISLSMKSSQYEQYCLPLFADVIGKRDKTDEMILASQALSYLEPKLREVLIYKYIYGYSDAELSKKYGVSRQSVNKMKIKALAKLRRYFKV